jgi:tetratricopeptide (TPR) repeat protein
LPDFCLIRAALIELSSLPDTIVALATNFEANEAMTMRRVTKRRWPVLLCVLALLGAGSFGAAAADDVNDCDSPETEKRIDACTALIDAPGTVPTRRATAYANRALAYSLRAQYEAAVRDYDAAIAMFPEFAVALNNRAWAYFKWGKLAKATPDVELSLKLDPLSPHSYDTRAHIAQWEGNQPSALHDYDAAMLYGGNRMVTLYQCGLKMAKLYLGPADGVVRPELRTALRACVAKKGDCDPLPPDEECREATS